MTQYTTQELIERLIDAICEDNVEKVKDLLLLGADPNGFIDQDQLTALHFVVRKNAIHSAKILLLAGAHPHFYCRGLETTPMQAAKLAKNKELELLLSQFQAAFQTLC